MIKIKLYISLIILCFGFFTHTHSQQTPQLDWSTLSPNNGVVHTGLTAKDDLGNLYVLGSLSNNSITVNGTTISAPPFTVVLIKYDINQTPIQIKEIPVIQSYDNISPHKFLYHNGALYLFVEYRYNNMSMDGINFPPVESVGGTVGAGNLALIKIESSSFNTEWIKFITRPGCFQTIPADNMEIYFDKNDKIHAIGTFSNKLIFDSGEVVEDVNDTVGVNAYHAVYDTTGILISANDLGIYNLNPNYFAYEYFSMDNQNNIYRFIRDTKDFIKYDSQDNIIFAKQFQSNGGVTITGMVTDLWGNVYLSGYFSSSTMSFDNVTTTKTGGTTDAVLIKFDSDNGNVDWVKNLQDPFCDRFDFINIDAIGNIYVLNNQYGFCSSPGWSMLAKFNSNGDLLYKDTLNGSALFPNAFPGNGVAMTRAGNISLPPDGGAILVSGSLKSGQNVQKGFIVKYGICNTPPPTVNVDYSDICEGETATLSVDSLSGYKYLWSNGDTTATTQITESGRYSVVAIQDEECYSESEDFYINVHPLPDTTITVNNNILTATDTTQGLFYQWIDCQNNIMPISGATEQTFEPVQNGEYAVIVTSENGCSDTSACHVVNTLSIQNNPLLDKQITLYPNPTSDKINVQTDLEIAEVYLLDLQGKQLQTSNSKEVDLSKLSSGIYLIKVKLKNNEIWTNKVIKN